MSKKRDRFVEGFACAVRIMASAPMEPLTVWQEGGFTSDDLDGVDPGDADVIRELYFNEGHDTPPTPQEANDER